PSVKGWIMGTNVRTTAAVLDSLVRLRPDHPLLQSTIRWLMAARGGDNGYWETTHDTPQSLLALTDYLSQSGELEGHFEWQLAVNGQTRSSGAVDSSHLMDPPARVSIPLPRLMIGQNRVQLIRSAGAGRLYYSLQLTSFNQSDDLPFVSQGF